MENVSQQEMMRNAVKGAYHSERWWKKVDKMTDNQLFAVYSRLKSQNKIY